MKKLLLLLPLLILQAFQGQSQEPYLANETYTYAEVISEYEQLVADYPKLCALQEHGFSDYGEPMSLFLISKVGFTKEDFKDKTVLMVNNGIHPGEPCGVDASVKLAKELLSNPSLISEEVVIGIIPIYNIGGAMNRGCCSRTNQNGPKEYGFRGNAKNLDLNRDFIKADSKNTLAFYRIFHLLNPHIFIDTHTSNGADYQHIMTLITSQMDKMHPKLRRFTKEKLNPHLFQSMKKSGYDMVPYVHTVDQIPDKGIMDYLETPRYSTGYTNLFNTIGYVSETHMLKTFEERVESTYSLLKITYNYCRDHHDELKSLKREVDYGIGQEESFDINWALDTTRFDMIDFKGYTAEFKPSDVSGQERLFYNREKPFEKQIRYYNRYNPTTTVSRPEYYVIPKSWDFVVKLFEANGIDVFQLNEDAELEVEVYRIARYESVKRPYQGHYLHHHIEVQKEKRKVQYRKGDYVVPTRNANVRFIIETLEPHAADSYLAWNYFDAILQQQEWYSAYVFEDEAADLLKSDPEIKKKFDQRMKDDEAFRENANAQLYYLFQLSSHYEPTHNLYPIARHPTEIPADLLTD